MVQSSHEIFNIANMSFHIIPNKILAKIHGIAITHPNILNKSETATHELFAIYIQNYANQECNWKCILMFKYLVMHNSKIFTDVVTRKHMKAI